jgi:hypothetical protein
MRLLGKTGDRQPWQPALCLEMSLVLMEQNEGKKPQVFVPSLSFCNKEMLGLLWYLINLTGSLQPPASAGSQPTWIIGLIHFYYYFI